MTVMSHRDVTLGNCRPFRTYSSDTTLTCTFDVVAKVPPSAIPDLSTLARSLPLLQKHTHRAGTIEQHVVHEIAHHPTPFVATLSRWRCASFTHIFL